MESWIERSCSLATSSKFSENSNCRVSLLCNARDLKFGSLVWLPCSFQAFFKLLHILSDVPSRKGPIPGKQNTLENLVYTRLKKLFGAKLSKRVFETERKAHSSGKFAIFVYTQHTTHTRRTPQTYSTVFAARQDGHVRGNTSSPVSTSQVEGICCLNYIHT